jgi:SAM-dependent methyltransferase
MPEVSRCWVCDGNELGLVKPSNVASLRPSDFAISDAHYGRTAAVYACRACGFMQCADMNEVVSYYRDLEDDAYVASRPERLMHARRLLRRIARLLGRDLKGLRLLDVGAGSGPLVEEALALGMDAEGVEPSTSLCAEAIRRKLPVHHGVLPHPLVRGPFDVVTLIDVIEHVTDPLALVQSAVAAAKRDGMVVVVTPDVNSIPARILKWRWWHFRVAHVGYFSHRTLEHLCGRAGLAAKRWARPDWVLPLPYLLERVERYLPSAVRLPRSRWMDGVAVPFNLRDSILMFGVVHDAPTTKRIDRIA